MLAVDTNKDGNEAPRLRGAQAAQQEWSIVVIY